jgi:hypothetical protein
VLSITIRALWARPGATEERMPLSDRRFSAPDAETWATRTCVKSSSLFAVRVGRLGRPRLRLTMTELRVLGGTPC